MPDMASNFLLSNLPASSASSNIFAENSEKNSFTFTRINAFE